MKTTIVIHYNTFLLKIKLLMRRILTILHQNIGNLLHMI